MMNTGTCPACGSTETRWDHTLKGSDAIQDGLHRLHEIQVLLHLGCDACSHTLISGVRLEDVINGGLTSHLSDGERGADANERYALIAWTENLEEHVCCFDDVDTHIPRIRELLAPR